MRIETPQLQPIVPSCRLRILSDEQSEQLQSAPLEILERTGIHCPSEEALNVCAEHGAQQAEFRRILGAAERELG